MEDLLVDKWEELQFRHHANADWTILIFDWLEIKGHHVLVAIGIDKSGHKRILGCQYGLPSDPATSQTLINGLVLRGVESQRKRLYIISDSNHLRNTIAGMFGSYAIIQRCRMHYFKDVIAPLTAPIKNMLKDSMRTAFNLPGEQGLQHLVEQLEQLRLEFPLVAANIEEGLIETMTINRLGLTPALRKELGSTAMVHRLEKHLRHNHPPLSKKSRSETVMKRIAPAMLRIEEKFRRITGYRDMWILEAALEDEMVPPLSDQEFTVMSFTEDEPSKAEEKKSKRYTRSHKRWEVDGITGTIQRTTQAKVRDISVTGLAVETMAPLKVGRILHFKLTNANTTVDLEGRVVWCHLTQTRKNEDGDVVPIYNSGVGFPDMLSESGNDLARFLNTSVEIAIERRVFGRFKFKDDLTKVELDHEITFLLKKINIKGMQILTDQAMNQGDTSSFELKLGDATFQTEGKVIFSEQTPKQRQFMVGIEFQKTLKKQLKLLQSFLSSEIKLQS